jgi:hypothetical protein
MRLLSLLGYLYFGGLVWLQELISNAIMGFKVIGLHAKNMITILGHNRRGGVYMTI